MDQGPGPSGDHQGSQPSGLQKPRGIKKYLKKYTIRDVVHAQYGPKISDLASQESQDKLGTSAYLAAYPHALTAIIQALTQEEIEVMEKLVEQWNEDGAPDAQKKK